MAKKLKFDSDVLDDVILLGIVSHLKEYRLAFCINKELEINLKRFDDFKSGENSVNYSWYYYSLGEKYHNITMVSNSSSGEKLLFEHKVDYLIFIKGVNDLQVVANTINAIRKIAEVSMVFQIPLEKLKNIQPLLEALEMHEMKQIAKPHKKNRKLL